MTNRTGFTWVARVMTLCAVIVSGFSVQRAMAKEHCPAGLWPSAGSCCEPGSEYVPTKNQCLPVRPERRCAQGHLDDCVTAARSLEQQGKVGEGYAVELFRYACEEGHAPGCRGLAQLYNEGRGVERDAKRAMALWEDACAQGDAPACTTLAHLLSKGGREDDRVLTLLAMGCHRGDADACDYYAVTMARSVSAKGSDKDTITSYLERACSGGVGRACRSLLTSERNVMSPAREQELLGHACRAQDDDACSRLSSFFQTAPQSTRKQ